ncbi:hypothetical protein KR222_007963, partial [Zaprionus bogoriensis]
KMFGISGQLQTLLHGHYDVLAAGCLLSMLLVAILNYAHSAHDCDLLCWRHHLDGMEHKPMLAMLFVAGFKLLLILILAVLSYTQVRQHAEPPIAHVKQRYCRYLLMRLLAAHEEFVVQRSRTIEERHAALLEAIQLFRADARKLCERTSRQLRVPIQQLLPVEEEEEQQLLTRGYDGIKCIKQFKERDIYRMVLAL